MSLLLGNDEARYASLGRRLVKLALSAPEPVYAMAGKLYLAASGWLLLSVPNGLVRSIYENLDEVGVELPPGKDGQPFNAHISVMRPEEVEEIGGADVISERGHAFHYNIGRLATVVPVGWEEMSKCWLLQVSSPELMQLRRSYGLSSLPQRNGESLGFHISVAVRRKGVLRSGEVSKVSKDVNEISAVLRQAREDTNTEPTEAQRESGNYKKGKLRLHGLEISLENPKGSTRSGVSPDGKAWSTEMKHDYGYIRGTTGNDDDHVDVFLHDNPVTELVHIVNQQNADGSFDEHKCLIGFGTTEEAEAAYLANYEKGWDSYGEITPVTIPIFKWWLEHGDLTKPIEDGYVCKNRRVKAAGDDAVPVAGIKVKESYDPICPHCEQVMYEKHFAPDRESPGENLWRHRGDCYDKGPFRIEWPDQAERDAEYEGFKKMWGRDKESSELPPITIDRPKGFKKVFQTKAGPVEEEYPLDYGYFEGHINPQDNEEADVFVGSGGNRHGRYMKGTDLTGEWQPDEHKWYTGLTDDEHTNMMHWWGKQNPDLVREDTAFSDIASLLADLQALKQNKEASRNCPGCQQPFKDDEPYPDVDMCEVCERYGKPKTAFDLTTIPGAIGKVPGQVADYWNALSPEVQGNTVQIAGSMGVGAGMNAITGAVSAEPGYRLEAAKRDAFRGVINGLAGYAAVKGTQHMFNDSGQHPVTAAISGLGGLALSKALHGTGYPLERAIFGRPSWDVLPEDLAALREDLTNEQEEPDDKTANVLPRALNAQLAKPQWDANANLFDNLLGNVSQLRQRGQTMIRDHQQAQAFRETLNPALGDERLQRIFAGEHESLDPVDQLAFGEFS